MIELVILGVVLVSMLCTIIRSIAGPTSFDRILACNSFGTHTVIMIGLVGVVTHHDFYLDIALVYALINFIATIAFLRYYKYGTFNELPLDALQPTHLDNEEIA
ncbi:MAG: hypothetical protein IPP74_11770 [Alphaproteobacteria bacterium]|nr:hypothetical protein [Alphaproteobacteria bacterium]